MKRVRVKDGEEAVKVRCRDCLHFQRDTEGISYSFKDHEFFMGICQVYHGVDRHPYGLKVFADNERICRKWKATQK